jgi:6-pyruvoyltetrahydropterin/6-carboxytetrahydropterin synthase
VIAELTRSYEIDAAHRLPSVPKGHKCARMHGHGFRIEVTVRGKVGRRTGWVTDFADIDGAARPVIDSLDHRTLNDLPGLANPTSELLAAWIWEKLAPHLPGLHEVAVSESARARCAYRGE